MFIYAYKNLISLFCILLFLKALFFLFLFGIASNKSYWRGLHDIEYMYIYKNKPGNEMVRYTAFKLHIGTQWPNQCTT